MNHSYVRRYLGSNMRANPSTSVIIQYALIGFPLAFAGLPLYLHAPDFYIAEMGLNLGVLGSVLLLIRLIDAVQDPFIGRLSDRYPQHRAAIMLLGAFLLFTGMALLFAIPPVFFSPMLWFAVSMILATTGFSILTIHVTMLGGLWSSHTGVKNRVSAWREGMALIGLLTASILPATIALHYSADTAYTVLFIVFAISLVLAYGLLMRVYPQAQCVVTHSAATASNSINTFFQLLTGRLKHFWLLCFINHLAAAVPAVLVLFFIRDYLDAEDYTGLFLMIYFLSGALLMPFWVKLAKKIGQEKAWLSAIVLAVVTFLWAYWLEAGDVMLYGGICFAAGMALGADLTLPPALLGKYLERYQCQSQATQHYALLALMPKLSLAIASGSAFIYLDSQGFEAASNNSQQALSSLITVYALIPCLIKILAGVLIWRWIKKQENTHEPS